MRSFLSYENDFEVRAEFRAARVLFLRRLSISEKAAYGLDKNNVVGEDAPLVAAEPINIKLVRESQVNIGLSAFEFTAYEVVTGQKIR